MLINTKEDCLDRNYAMQQRILSRLDDMIMICEKKGDTGGHFPLTSVEELDEFERSIQGRKHFRQLVRI